MLKTVMTGSALIIFTCSLSLSAYAMADGAKRAIHIPSGDLAMALELLAKQSGSDLVYRPEQAQGLKTRGVSGELSTEEAVAELLKGTPLILSTDSTGAMLIAAPLPTRNREPTQSSLPRNRQPSKATGQERAGFWSRFHLAQADNSSPSQEEGKGEDDQGRGEAGEPASQKKSVQLEEVIVTAQKRKQALQEIPQSVTVLSAETLARQQAHDLQDYVGLIPGMSLQSNARGLSRLTLRGINAGGVASTVAVYVDEVPYGSSSGLADAFFLSGDFDTLDVDRLEVLRGPQGTLYGASALGGVLKFVTKEPQTGAFTASASASAESLTGGDLGYAGTGTLNIPLGERFAVRASGFYRRDGGFIDSVSGPILELGGPRVILDARKKDDLNEVKVYGGRVSGLFKATDTLSVRLTALLQNIDSGTSNLIETDPTTLEPLNGRLSFSQYHPESVNIKYRIYSAALDWDLGFASLVSSSSYATLENTFVTDFTFAFAPALTAIFGDPLARPIGAVRHQQTTTNKTTQELRLASPDNDTFEWLVGAFFTHEKSQIGPQAIRGTEGITDTFATDVPLVSDALLPTTYQEYAGFANATWHFTPRFDLSFGGRWGHNKQDAELSITGFINGPGLMIPPGVLASAEDVFTYSVAPRFELSDTAALYARAATGYRPGGPNIVPPAAPPGTPFTYQADRTTNYELGLKADWFDRAFSLDIAAYYIDWKDIQLAAAINGVGVNTNGGTAVSKGVEFAAMARPARGLTLRLDGAYADAYLTQDTPALTGGFDGDPLPYVPDWSLNLSGDYEWPVLDNSTAYVGSSVRYVGEQTSDFGVRTSTGSIRQISSYEILDLRAGLRTERWSLDAYAKNVGDKRALTSIQLLPVGFLPNGAIGTGINRPRTIGLNVSVRF